MQKLPESGRVKNIGVSNFAIKNLEKLFADSRFKTTLRKYISSTG
jgi:glycerol 2-dehydrogenase (NADP+)